MHSLSVCNYANRILAQGHPFNLLSIISFIWFFLKYSLLYENLILFPNNLSIICNLFCSIRMQVYCIVVRRQQIFGMFGSLPNAQIARPIQNARIRLTTLTGQTGPRPQSPLLKVGLGPAREFPTVMNCHCPDSGLASSDPTSSPLTASWGVGLLWGCGEIF